MNSDIAVGMSGDQLNQTTAAVYKALYPKVFTGSHQVQYQGITFTVGIDVQQPPSFDLSVKQAADEVAQALTERAGTQSDARDEPAEGSREEILAAVAASFPSFAMRLPAVALTLANGTTTKLTLALTAQCYLENGPATISFVPYSVTAPDQSDPVTNYLVKTIVLPAVKDMLTQLLSGVTIPPIQVSGVPLTSPSVGIVNGYVVAAANMTGSSTPPPPDGSFPWPATPFFALLGPGIIQQLGVIAAASSTNKFSDSGSGGDFWGGYKWNYGLSLTDPRAVIAGSGVKFTFTLKGTVSAGVHVTYLSIDLGFDAHAAPDPSANAGFLVQGDQLVLTASSIDPFTIYVLPNSVPTWVLGWLIAAIISGVTLTLTPLVTAFLKDIRLASYAVPTYSIAIENTKLTLKPSNLQVSGVAGTIALTGGATVSPG